MAVNGISSGLSGPPPLVVGIAGGSGSGKTTIARELQAALADVTLIQHDSYYRHRPHLSFEQRSSVNYDHPDSLETELLIHHLQVMAEGAAIVRPTYDFTLHLRVPDPERIEPGRVIIVEGILVLADAELRKHLDLKIYVDTDPAVRLSRRLRRDIEERGRSRESVLQQYATYVGPGHQEFVEPSKAHADLILSDGDDLAAIATLIARAEARGPQRPPLTGSLRVDSPRRHEADLAVRRSGS